MFIVVRVPDKGDLKIVGVFSSFEKAKPVLQELDCCIEVELDKLAEIKPETLYYYVNGELTTLE